jgi:hypothetical protein
VCVVNLNLGPLGQAPGSFIASYSVQKTERRKTIASWAVEDQHEILIRGIADCHVAHLLDGAIKPRLREQARYEDC